MPDGKGSEETGGHADHACGRTVIVSAPAAEEVGTP